MIRILRVALLALPALAIASAHAQIAHVQSCGMQATGDVPSVACTMNAPIAAGDFLFICVANASAPMPALTISGDAGKLVPDPNFQGQTYGDNSQAASCNWIASAGGGGSTITASGTGLSYSGISVDEFSGVGALDVEDAWTTGSSASPTASSTLTPIASGDLVLAFISAGGDPESIAGAGWTLGAQGIGPPGQGRLGAIEYQINAPAGDLTAASALSSSQPWILHAIAFRPASSTVTPPALPIGPNEPAEPQGPSGTSAPVPSIQIALPVAPATAYTITLSGFNFIPGISPGGWAFTCAAPVAVSPPN